MPTLTPLPSVICSAPATFMTSRASGSMSGCAGFDGQIACGPVEATCELSPAIAPSAGPGPLPSDAKCRSASGTTAWTAGSAWRCLTSAAEIVADMASMSEKLRTLVACSWVSSARTPAWAAVAALMRARVSDRVAGRRPS